MSDAGPAHAASATIVERHPEHLSELSSPGVDTVVMVPGIDGTALLFYRQIPSLAETFNVVAFPLPDDPDATMEGLANDLARLIEEVAGPAGAILVGESFGGALAMTTALARPDLVKGLVVLNSFPWVSERLELWLGPRLLRLVPWAAMPLARRFTEARIHSPHTSAEDLAEFHERALAIGRLGYLQRLRILWDYDLRDQLRTVSVPTLLLAADRDELVPSVKWAVFMAERIPNAEMHVLAGYGHVCLITHDLDLAKLVIPLWQRVG